MKLADTHGTYIVVRLLFKASVSKNPKVKLLQLIKFLFNLYTVHYNEITESMYCNCKKYPLGLHVFTKMASLQQVTKQ